MTVNAVHAVPPLTVVGRADESETSGVSSPEAGGKRDEPISGVQEAVPELPLACQVLSLAERIRGTATIAVLQPDGRALGEILVAQGQVYWVRLSDKPMPLLALVAERDPVQAGALRALLAEAKAGGRSFADVLKVLDAEQSRIIRLALHAHFAASLVFLEQHEGPRCGPALVQISDRALGSVLSGFSPASLYWEAISRLHPPIDDAAHRCYRALAALGRAGVLARRSQQPGQPSLPLRVDGMEEEISMESLMRLGHALESFHAMGTMAAAGQSGSKLLLLDAAQDASLVVMSATHIALIDGLARSARAQAFGRAHELVFAS